MRSHKLVKSIVIAGVENGNMNKASVHAAAKQGAVVERSSHAPTGTVGRNVKVEEDKLGFIATDELNSKKSCILLSLALLKQTTPREIQKLFQTY